MEWFSCVIVTNIVPTVPKVNPGIENDQLNSVWAGHCGYAVFSLAAAESEEELPSSTTLKSPKTKMKVGQ